MRILEDRFVFVEYQLEEIGVEVSPYTIMVDDKPLTMKRVVVEDFKIIYRALEGKKSKLPVRILRRFKQELYDFTVTNMPTASMHVASIEDDRVKDESGGVHLHIRFDGEVKCIDQKWLSRKKYM